MIIVLEICKQSYNENNDIVKQADNWKKMRQ